MSPPRLSSSRIVLKNLDNELIADHSLKLNLFYVRGRATYYVTSSFWQSSKQTESNHHRTYVAWLGTYNKGEHTA